MVAPAFVSSAASPKKPAKRKWEEESWDEPVAAKSQKKLKKKQPESLSRIARPDELPPGTVVLYWDGCRGEIHDAFEPLDEFWVADEFGNLVRDENDDIYHFKSAELQLPVTAAARSAVAGGSLAGVLLLGTEGQMTKILDNFGFEKKETRENPQQLLALPCNYCTPDKIRQCAADGVSDDVVELAKRLREDIDVSVRTFHLRQAVLQLGSQLTSAALENYYLMASVQIPWGRQDIDLAKTDRDRHLKKEVENQIDFHITSIGEYADEPSNDAAARRALGENCGVEVSDILWSETAQRAIRTNLGVGDLPLKFVDANGIDVTVIVLPEGAILTVVKNILVYSEAPDTSKVKPAVAGAAPSSPQVPQRERSGEVNGKTIAQWESAQSEFAHLPKLPAGWLRIKSRSGQVYFYNKRTQQSTFEYPGQLPSRPSEGQLPPGWIKQVSKSNGKAYYFHSKRNISTYDQPTA